MAIENFTESLNSFYQQYGLVILVLLCALAFIMYRKAQDKKKERMRLEEELKKEKEPSISFDSLFLEKDFVDANFLPTSRRKHLEDRMKNIDDQIVEFTKKIMNAKRKYEEFMQVSRSYHTHLLALQDERKIVEGMVSSLGEQDGQ